MRPTFIAVALLLSGAPAAMAQTAFNSSTALPPSATSPAIPHAVLPTATPPVGTSPATGTDAIDTSVAVGPPRSILAPPNLMRPETVASTTPSMPMMDQGQVRERLQAMGYTDINSLRPKASGGWTAVANKGRSHVSVDMDSSGNIEPR